MATLGISSVNDQNSDLEWTTLTSGFDLDNALGRYRTELSAIIQSLLNSPISGGSGECTVEFYKTSSNGVYGYQIYTLVNSNNAQKFIRRKNGTQWTGWIEFVTKSDLKSGIISAVYKPSSFTFADLSDLQATLADSEISCMLVSHGSEIAAACGGDVVTIIAANILALVIGSSKIGIMRKNWESPKWISLV